MKRLLILTIGAIVYFVPAIVFWNVYHTWFGAAIWLSFGWVAAIFVMAYLDEE